MLHPIYHRSLFVISLVLVTVFSSSCSSVEELNTGEFSFKNRLNNVSSEGGYGYLCEGNICRLSEPTEELFSERVGFGRETTGGLGGAHCTVHNYEDSGEGTLRQCASMPGPVWITFDRSGTIRLDDKIKLPSNSTVDGRGHRIKIKGAGLIAKGVENVIITHLEVSDAKADAISLKDEAKRVWINHLSLSSSEDGLLDITMGSTDVTVSWCRFDDHRKVMLISSGHEHVIDNNIRVTVHHNFFNETFSRHPNVSRGKVHIYNNLFRKIKGNVITCSHYGQCISEGNIFDSEKTLVRTKGGAPEHGSIISINDWSVRGARIYERNPDDVFDAREFYDYEADNADEDLMDFIKSNAGWKRVDKDQNQYHSPQVNQCQDDLPTLEMPPAQHSAEELFADGAKIRLRASTGHYVTAEEGGGKSFVADREQASEWETFTVVLHDSGKIALKTSEDFFMTAELEPMGVLSANRQTLGEWELFTPIQVDGGRFALQAHTGQYVVAECGGGTFLAADRTDAGSWESFLIELSSAAQQSNDQPHDQPNDQTNHPVSPPTPINELFTMNHKIHIRASNGQYLCAEEGGGSIVNANRDQAGAWETFTVITHESGKIGLQTSGGLFLSADQGGGGRLYADRTHLGDWELFNVIILGDHKFALRTSNLHYIVSEGGGGGEVNANRIQRGEWETLAIQSAQ